MDTSLFLKGLLLGFSIAAPVGPIGLLCIRRTLADGRSSGLCTGLGAATADAMYGGVAAFGVTVVMDTLAGQALWLRILGGLFLCGLGLRTFCAEPASRAAAGEGGSLPRAYFSTLLLTLSNPVTIFSFAAVFAGMGVDGARAGYFPAATLVLGTFTGSAAWWLLLSSGVSLVRSRFTPTAMRWVNRVSGITILIFGLVALAASLPVFSGR